MDKNGNLQGNSDKEEGVFDSVEYECHKGWSV